MVLVFYQTFHERRNLLILFPIFVFLLFCSLTTLLFFSLTRSQWWRATPSRRSTKWLSICLTTGYLQFCQYVPKKLANLNAAVAHTFKYLISFSYPVLSTCQRMCSSSVTTSRWTSPTMVGRTNHPPFTIHQFPGMKVISSTIPHPRYEGHPP